MWNSRCQAPEVQLIVCAVAAHSGEVMRFILFQLGTCNSTANSAQAQQLDTKPH